MREGFLWLRKREIKKEEPKYVREGFLWLRKREIKKEKIDEEI